MSKTRKVRGLPIDPSSKVGECSLTGLRGRFVKSHVIPRGLTQIWPKELPIIHMSDRSRPVRRWDSWYDSRLVTQAGEDILTEYDTWGIGALRRHRLIWSSWGSSRELPAEHYQSHPDFGVRVVQDVDPIRLRLFFASLLWRAAATTLPEFAEISMEPRDLETLARSLVNRVPLSDNFYPVALTQYSTRGDAHIRAPFRTEMPVFDDDGKFLGTTPVFRFYFDGLTAHFRIPGTRFSMLHLGPHGIGNETFLSVATVPYQTSAEKIGMDRLIETARLNWADDMKRHRL